MKHFKRVQVCLIFSIAAVSALCAQSPVGKNLHEVIGIWGNNYNRLTDAQGLHILQYKKVVNKDTLADFLYFEGFTCVKEVSLRPASEKNLYIDSLNHQFTPVGTNSWRSKDSTYITIATRDGFLDITSLSAGYYKKIAH